MISHISRDANDVKGSPSFAASFLPSLFAQTIVHCTTCNFTQHNEQDNKAK